MQAPTAKATELANKANELAQKLGTVQKPWADATAALKTAEAAKTLIMQQQTIAARELQTAQQLVPSRKDLLLKAEAAVAAAKAAVEAAGLALQQSEQTIRAVSFSPDGESLATAGDFPGIQTWDGKLGTSAGIICCPHRARTHRCLQRQSIPDLQCRRSPALHLGYATGMGAGTDDRFGRTTGPALTPRHFSQLFRRFTTAAGCQRNSVATRRTGPVYHNRWKPSAQDSTGP